MQKIDNHEASPVTNLRIWRRQHSGHIIGQVTPTSGTGSWTTCIWRIADEAHRIEAGGPFALLTDARSAADELAVFTFQHRCDTACGPWAAMERPMNVDQSLGRPRLSKPMKLPPKAAKGFRAGDVIVTAVAHHYAIGRIGTDGIIQQPLGSDKSRVVALTLACQLAGAVHRVFLYQSAGDGKFARYNCRKIRSGAISPRKSSSQRRVTGRRDSTADGCTSAVAPTTTGSPTKRKRTQKHHNGSGS